MSMSLTSTQLDLLMCLRSAVEKERSPRIVYRTEYLGYLPFGFYHWITVGGKDIDSSDLPSEFSRRDLDALEAADLLYRVDQWINPEDDFDTKTTYDVSSI